MIELFSAIGLENYTRGRAFAELVGELYKRETRLCETYARTDTGQVLTEKRKNMGPFDLSLFTKGKEIVALLPSVREKRAVQFKDIGAKLMSDGMLYLSGRTDEPAQDIILISSQRAFFGASGEPEIEDKMLVSRYGLSASGSILLGTDGWSEDELASEEYRAQSRLMKDAAEGDRRAAQKLERLAENYRKEADERLDREDFFTVMESGMAPLNERASYRVLGHILCVEKIYNSFSGSWVYRLELWTQGRRFGVYINPRDLVGEPAPARRFEGRVTLMGMVNPADLKKDEDCCFY